MRISSKRTWRSVSLQTMNTSGVMVSETSTIAAMARPASGGAAGTQACPYTTEMNGPARIARPEKAGHNTAVKTSTVRR